MWNTLKYRSRLLYLTDRLNELHHLQRRSLPADQAVDEHDTDVLCE